MIVGMSESTSSDETRKEAAEKLSEDIAHRKRLEILDLFGTVDFDPTYDYKAERRRKDSVNKPSGSKA
jgi:hypothetical protein